MLAPASPRREIVMHAKTLVWWRWPCKRLHLYHLGQEHRWSELFLLLMVQEAVSHTGCATMDCLSSAKTNFQSIFVSHQCSNCPLPLLISDAILCLKISAPACLELERQSWPTCTREPFRCDEVHRLSCSAGCWSSSESHFGWFIDSRIVGKPLAVEKANPSEESSSWSTVSGVMVSSSTFRGSFPCFILLNRVQVPFVVEIVLVPPFPPGSPDPSACLTFLIPLLFSGHLAEARCDSQTVTIPRRLLIPSSLKCKIVHYRKIWLLQLYLWDAIECSNYLVGVDSRIRLVVKDNLLYEPDVNESFAWWWLSSCQTWYWWWTR